MSTEELIAATRQSLQALNVQRQALESEAEAITSELLQKPESGGEPMGIDTPLVDSEGYPRADIDLYRARTLRGRLAEIRTDHNNVMKDVEQHLQQMAALQQPSKALQEKEEYAARMASKPKPKYDPVSGKWVVKNWDGTVAGAPNGDKRSFDDITRQQAEETTIQEAESRMNRLTTSTTSTANDEPPTLPSSSGPFARVNSVAANSPAESAGLRENDLILSFGSVTGDNSSNPMQAVGEMVPSLAASQQSVTLQVQRRVDERQQQIEELIQIQLTPQPWSGRGLIGCHIVPHSSS